MANTVIQLKNSGATGNTPGTLQPGELAINYADGKLYYGNASNNAILFDVITEPAGLNQEIQFNDSGSFGSSANLKFDSSTKTLSTDNFVAANGVIASNLTASNVISHTALYVGIADISHTPLANSLGYFTGNSSPYVQVNIENIDPNGSSDLVATADVGSDETFYTDVGIQNSGHADGTIKPLDGYLLVQGNTGQVGGNLIIGTISGTPEQEIRVVVGGNEDANVVLKINSSGLQMVKGDITSNVITRTSDIANSAFDQANLAFDKANIGGGNSFSIISTSGFSDIIANTNNTRLTFYGQTGIAIGTDSQNSIISIATNLIGASNVIVDYGSITDNVGVITFDYGYLT